MNSTEAIYLPVCNFLNQCVSKQVTNRIPQIKSKSLKILTLIFAHKTENGTLYETTAYVANFVKLECTS